jgi:enoyl-CoA hydratase/carnithine racemase
MYLPVRFRRLGGSQPLYRTRGEVRVYPHRLLLTGDTISGAEAAAIGLVIEAPIKPRKHWTFRNA